MSDPLGQEDRSTSTTESRKSRLERYEAELRDLYKKVDRKLDQIKSLKERIGWKKERWRQRKKEEKSAKEERKKQPNS